MSSTWNIKEDSSNCCFQDNDNVNCIPSNYQSEVETAILNSNIPLEISESEEITVLGNKGIWLNRDEVARFSGNLNEYKVYEDTNPCVVSKKSEIGLEYIQELAIRYLRPPAPPAPGDIIITQEPDRPSPPAPPLIIRQQPARPSTPEPLIVREAPPQEPTPIGKKIITISGKRLPPPPRKVIIERLAALPNKPQAVITERWLPYTQSKRRVIFQAAPPAQAYCKPKNVIVQWQAPNVAIKQEVKYLGVVNANPADYIQRYGESLKSANQLPSIVRNIPVQEGIILAADYQYNPIHQLEGDLQALKLVDLEAEGLSCYRSQLIGSGHSSSSFINAPSAPIASTIFSFHNETLDSEFFTE